MSIRKGWICIGTGWALFAIGLVLVLLWMSVSSHSLLAHPALLAAWVSCYTVAVALFAAPYVADKIKTRRVGCPDHPEGVRE